MLDWIKGKKTYIVAVVGIIGAITAYSQGAMTADGLFQAILTALAAAGLRSAQVSESKKIINETK